MPKRQRAFLSIEIGGRYPEHPHIPSNDIFGDLAKNVAQAGFSDTVELINGGSRDAAVVERVKTLLGDKRISLLFIDADGNIDADWERYAPLLADDAVIVLDDYEAPLSPEKAGLVQPWADDIVTVGILRPLGIFGWGTWFGQANGELQGSA
jgi:Methyltransferase domain